MVGAGIAPRWPHARPRRGAGIPPVGRNDSLIGGAFHQSFTRSPYKIHDHSHYKTGAGGPTTARPHHDPAIGSQTPGPGTWILELGTWNLELRRARTSPRPSPRWRWCP